MTRTPAGGPDTVPFGPGIRCAVCTSVGVDSDGFCQTCGRAQPLARDHVEHDLGLVAGVSDRGLRREDNEDAVAFGWIGRPAAPRFVVAAVCDGVSTADRASEASQLAADSAVETLLTSLLNGTDATAATERAAAAAAEAVATLAGASTADVPACTLVSAVVGHTDVTIGWLGDSRAYWLTDSPAAHPPRRLTTDHTKAGALVAAGVAVAEADAHVDARALTRWIGADSAGAAPQVMTLRPAGAGTVLLCTDGLWRHLPSADDLSAYLPAGSGPDRAVTTARRLTDAAIDSGGHDNVAVVAVPFPMRPPAGQGRA